MTISWVLIACRCKTILPWQCISIKLTCAHRHIYQEKC